jgi:hypothetical protein
MLTRVVREIEGNLQHYKTYEEVTRILQTPSVIEKPPEMVAALERVSEGLAFFTANADFKKAEVMVRRFEGLRDQLVDKITLRVVKVLREYNRDLTLRVLHTRVFDEERAQQQPPPLSEEGFTGLLDYLYPNQAKSTGNKLQEDQQLVRSLCEALSRVSPQSLEARVFAGEYFDQRLYLLELYLDHVQRSLQQSTALETFVRGFLSSGYGPLIAREEANFGEWFGLLGRFSQFVRDCEGEHLLHKRLRPLVIACGDIKELCQVVDYIRRETEVRIAKESREQMLQELQERLLLVSHYQI